MNSSSYILLRITKYNFFEKIHVHDSELGNTLKSYVLNLMSFNAMNQCRFYYLQKGNEYSPEEDGIYPD